MSASETHNKRNVNRSIAESLDGLERTIATALQAGLRCEGVISTSFGCPYEGEVEPAGGPAEDGQRNASGGDQQQADVVGGHQPLAVAPLGVEGEEPADPDEREQ